jgi:heptosyltransferase-2/heptosyltransferase-3
VDDEAFKRVRAALTLAEGERYVVINPAGGSNPGMVMDAKRFPPEQFAALTERLAAHYNAKIVIVAGPKDASIVQTIRQHLHSPSLELVGQLTFPEIAALAHHALVYIGNDTGLTHLAAAAGAKTVMILGPSDPTRYAPFAPNAIAVWKPVALHAAGAASGMLLDWDWQRDGVGVDVVYEQVVEFLAAN